MGLGEAGKNLLKQQPNTQHDISCTTLDIEFARLRFDREIKN
jgi:hypothetical protein